MAKAKKNPAPEGATVTVKMWGSLKHEGSLIGADITFSRPLKPGEDIDSAYSEVINLVGSKLTKGVNAAFNFMGFDSPLEE